MFQSSPCEFYYSTDWVQQFSNEEAFMEITACEYQVESVNICTCDCLGCLWSSHWEAQIKRVTAEGVKVLHAVLPWQERRRLQHMQMLQKQKETTEKIAAHAFAQQYLADLIPSVFNNLRESGFFYDPIERGLYSFLIVFKCVNWVM